MTLVLFYDKFITMNGLTTVTTKGQVTIPEAVRQALEINIGDKVAFTKILPTYNEVVIKIIPADIVEELSGSLSTGVKVKNSKKARRKAGKLLIKKYEIK